APGAVDVAVANANGSDTLTAAFTFDAPPTLVSIAPTSGSPLGGTVVTLTGTAFTAATSVTFGGTPAASVTFVNATTLDATTPAHAPGAVDVAVANAGGTATLSAAFTFAAPPILSSVSPASGSPLGGATVTLAGSGFTPDAVVTFGVNPSPSVTFTSASSLQAVTPVGTSGSTVNVTVSSVNGSSTLINGYAYGSPPTIVGLSPTIGNTAGGTAVSIFGSGFGPTTLVTFGGVSATSVTLISATSLTAVTPPHAPGAFDVTVLDTNGSSSLAGSFTFAPPPVLLSVSPPSGTPLGGQTLTLAGTGFVPNMSVLIGGQPATGVLVASPSSATVLSPAHAPGVVSVTITTAIGSSILPSGFTYESPPVLLSVSPPAGDSAGGELLTLSGTNFTAGATVLLDGQLLSSTFVNASTIQVLSPAHASGQVDVAVSNANGTSTLPNGFLYLAVDPPTLTSVAPVSGSPLGGDSVTLVGTNFTPTTTVTFDGVSASSLTFTSPQSITVTTPPHVPGTVDVVATTANGSSNLPAAFQYASPPVITAVNPSGGSPLGGDVVTVSGANLTTSTVVRFAGAASPGVTFVDANTLEVITPPGPSGPVDVAVENANGASTLANGFDYAVPPTVTGVSPAGGPPAGGTAVTITGTGFATGATVRFGGTLATSVNVLSTTQLTAVTPARPFGAADVTVTTANGTGTSSGAFLYFPPNLMQVTPALAQPGGSFQTEVLLTNQNAIAGYTCVLTFDNSVLTLNSISVAGTATVLLVGPNGASGGIEFFSSSINNVAGFGTGTCIFDTTPPFNQQTFPPGTARSILKYQFGAVDDPLLLGTCSTLTLENNIGNPPLNNTISQSGVSILPGLLPADVCFVSDSLFVRGDPNADGTSNIADAIFVLSFLFTGGASPSCLASADMNRDGAIDISDIVYVLFWQFNGGAAPPEPYPNCGGDVDDQLGCTAFGPC
ncbi:MAG: beta strand repeat-containing protein, partial [Planctomycetota bacterium]